jgi:phosphoglycolate phosphatase-like HAD superfamily hydrolase
MVKKPLILFDMDGTLITNQNMPFYQKNTIRNAIYISVKRQMKQIAISYGVPVDELLGLERMALIWNKARTYAKSQGFSQRKIREMMKAINVHFTYDEAIDHENIVLLPKTLEALETLHIEGFDLGVVTNASREAYERISNNSDLGNFGKYFQYSITRDDCDYLKPDPEPINRILKIFRQSNFVYVGDTDHDAKATRDANGVFILINTRGYNSDIIKNMTPHAVIHNLAELPKIMKKLQVQ